MKKAFVLINCNMGKEKDILTALRTMNQMKETHGIWETYDIIAEVNSDNAESLHENITWDIHKLPSIKATLSFMAIEG